MLIGWISNGVTLLLGISLLLNKNYRHLKLVKAYAFGSIALSFAYKVFFYNWHFYLISVMGQAALFALAYWEVAKKQEHKSFHFLLVAASAVLLIPLLPISFVAKTVLPFAFVNIAIIFALPSAFKSRNPLLIIWGVMAAYAFLILDVLKLLIPSTHQIVQIMTAFDVWANMLTDISITAAILWQPITIWAYRRLPKPALSLVPAGAEHSPLGAKMHNIREFSSMADTISGDTEEESDPKELESIFKSTAKTFTLGHKPFLAQKEAMHYLDMTEEELEDFLARYKIRKFYLTGNKDKWVVRRAEVENID